MNKKIIFFGSDALSFEVLKILISNKKWEIVLWVSNFKLHAKNHHLFSEIHNFCNKNKLKILTPKNINAQATILKKFNPDLIITCSYGLILKKEILDITKIINIHPSLLPKYRGAAPIERCIMNGDKISGVTILKTINKLDAGDYYFKKQFSINQNDTLIEVYQKVINVLNINLNKWILKILTSEKLKTFEQNENLKSYAKKIIKVEFLINFNLPILKVNNKIRALINKYPIFFNIHNKRFIIYDYEMIKKDNFNHKPSIIYDFSDKGLSITTKNGIINILKIKPENKKCMTIKHFYNGWQKIIKKNDLVNDN